MSKNKNRAVFLDRDGTLNLDKGYLYKVDDFEFFPGVIEVLQQIKAKGYLLVLVTNQSGIARGYFSEEEFINLTEWMDWSLADRGVDLDGIYYCPHHPEAKDIQYRQQCDCRKPEAGMFLTAQQELNIDFTHSFMVGDKLSDLEAAQKVGIPNRFLIRWPEQDGYEQKINGAKRGDDSAMLQDDRDYHLITSLKMLLNYL